MGSELVPYQDMEKMAADVIAAGIFPGFKTKAQVMSLFLLCQAEGLHPMKATQLFDVLPTGKVGIKSSALQASFQARGGKIRWITVTDTECEAEFMSKGLEEPIRVRWDMNDAKRAGLDTRPPWRQYPKAMLAARVTTDGINRADPGARFGGLYPTEVAQDIEAEDRGQRGMKALLTVGYGEPGTAQGTTPTPEPEPEPTEEELESPAILSPTPTKEEILEAFGLEETAAKEHVEGLKKGRAKILEPETPPASCPKCDGPLGEFKSSQKKYPGRVYIGCAWAYGQRGRLMDDFKATPEEAAQATIGHYRAWKGPWNGIEAKAT